VTGGRPVVDVLGDVLRGFLGDQQLERPHVAGNSLGGRIALEAAAAGDARSVTALSPAGFWPTERAFGYTRRLFATVSRVSQLLEPQAERLARTSWGRIVACGWITAHPTRIEPDQALGDFRAFRRAQPALRELVAGATRFSSVIAPDVPVTIAWATRDAVLPRNQANVARALLPHAEHILLPGCGHVPMSDDPRRVAGVILRGSADGWQPRRGANGRKRTTA
jgi:pimeloyl-ACP methyl ester carboxylesterase